jgi:hypothetical protein
MKFKTTHLCNIGSRRSDFLVLCLQNEQQEDDMEGVIVKPLVNRDHTLHPLLLLEWQEMYTK